jgi:hypothetical protein
VLVETPAAGGVFPIGLIFDCHWRGLGERQTADWENRPLKNDEIGLIMRTVGDVDGVN